ALFGEIVIPFQYAGVTSGGTTRGLRPNDSPEQRVSNADEYFGAMAQQGIYLSRETRQKIIVDQIEALAKEVDGFIPPDQRLLDEVTNLIEAPMALRGTFDPQ